MPPHRKYDPDAPRKVVYPDIKLYKGCSDKAITVELSKALLGWTEVSGSDPYHFRDLNGKRIFCTNNVHNRPLYHGLVENYMQEHLRRRWRFNGEPVIIGTTGLVLNGQHSLISHVLAEQMRVKPKYKARWAEYWDGPVTMEKLIVYGIKESDDVVDTMDTCRPRSVADILYKAPEFKGLSPQGRRVTGRMAAYATNFLWDRTGVKLRREGYFNPRKTNTESTDFVQRHPGLLKCVSHVYREYGVGQRWKDNVVLMSPGYMAGVMYLAATSASDPEIYRNGDRVEKDLDLDNWGKAEEFVSLFASSDPQMKFLRATLTKMADPRDGVRVSILERVSVLALAWQAFARGEPVTTKALKLSYRPKVEGQPPALKEVPEFGGIDTAGQRYQEPSHEDEGSFPEEGTHSHPEGDGREEDHPGYQDDVPPEDALDHEVNESAQEPHNEEEEIQAAKKAREDDEERAEKQTKAKAKRVASTNKRRRLTKAKA